MAVAPPRLADGERVIGFEDWRDFQRANGALLSSLLSTRFGAPVRWMTGPMPPRGAGRQPRRRPDRRLDWVTWFARAYDSNNNQRAIAIDFESTIHNLARNAEYVADKVAALREVLGAFGTFVAAAADARGNPRHGQFEDLTQEPELFLIFLSNSSSSLPSSGDLQALLQTGSPGFQASDPNYRCDSIPTRPGLAEALKVTLPGGRQIHVGLVGRKKLLELYHMAKTLDATTRREDHDDRFLFELTEVAGDGYTIRPLDQFVELLSGSAPDPVIVDGRQVKFIKVSMNPLHFLRLSTVLRLVSDFGWLQRLPLREHLASMATFVDAKSRFPTPLLCILPPEVDISARGSGGTQWRLSFRARPAQPYSLQLVDGQHRAFSYYLSTNGNPQPIDINCYILNNEDDRSFVASSLFLNVNYKAIKPPIDLALLHHSQAPAWPQGWIGKNKASGFRNYDKELNSGRVLATRFLFELNKSHRLFEDFFRVEGAAGRQKVSIQSITTYLSSDFDMPKPDDPGQPFARTWGRAPGGDGTWNVVEPEPDALQSFWSKLVPDFEGFVNRIAPSSSPPGFSLDDLRHAILENNNVFVAVWRLYTWCRFGGVSPSTHAAIPQRWPLTDPQASNIRSKLKDLETAGELYGPTSPYKSARGTRTLPLEILAAV